MGGQVRGRQVIQGIEKTASGSPQAGSLGVGLGVPNAFIAWAIRIERTLDAILGLMLLTVTLALFDQVFGRYVVGRAPAWTEEVARMMVAWMAMLGTGACLREGGHVAVGALVNSVSPRVKVVLLALRDIAVMTTAGVLGWAGTRFAMLNAEQESAALEIPMAIPYSAMAVGAVLLALVLTLARLGGQTPAVDSILPVE
jgi:TRAP-type C4-dicarboxylate transport system permease small subunit